jgi:hypothetical protein
MGFASLYPSYGFANLFLRIFAVNRAIGGSGGTPALPRAFVRSRKTDCVPASYTGEALPLRDNA